MRVLKNILISVVVVAALGFASGCVVLHMKVFGSNPEGARLERIEKSPQYQDGIFVNPIETPMMAEDASYLKMLYGFFKPSKEKQPQQTLPSITRNLPVATDQPTLTWFGHSSYLIQAQGKNFLMDPVFSGYAAPFSFAGPGAYPGTNHYQIGNLPPIDYVMISHDHYDHLDYETILQLKDQKTRFIVPLGVGAHLERWGIALSRITELDWWEKVQVDADFELIATPARHFSGRGLDRGKTLWASFVLRSKDLNLYLGGDSGYGPHFRAIGDAYGPFDLALLECGQYNPMWPYIHMMPEEVVLAANDLHAKVLQPVHWAKFTLSLHPWKEPVTRVSKAAMERNLPLCTPMIGEAVLLKRQYPNHWWWVALM